MIRWLIKKLHLSHCPECVELVDFALDGLEDTQRSSVREHLARCPRCLEQVRDFLQVNEALGMSAPETDCPEGFEQRVMQRLKVECAAPWSALPADATTASGIQGGWPLFWLRLGPVFCGLSVVMTFVAFTALWHGGAPAAASSDLARMTEALVNDPHAVKVSLQGPQGSGGEVVLCPGMNAIYLKAGKMQACKKGHTYVLWMQPKGAPVPERVGGFLVEAESRQFQLLQMPQAFDKKGTVQFILTQEAIDPKERHIEQPLMSGSVDL